MQSAIYEGWVMHRRLRPKVHRFKYRVFSLLIDLDDLPRLDRLRLFGWNRRGLFSFFECDHGPASGDKRDLRTWLDGLLQDAGILPGGAKRVLCYPRILGHVFNPLSVWFCDDEAGQLKAIVYEVHNTYDEGHAYVFPVTATDVARHDCAKDFYVSPFLAKDCRYHFRIAPPGERTAVAIHETQGGQAILNASFAGARRALTDAALLRLFFRYPLMTLKVVVAIHFEAVRLMLKGIRRHAHAPLAEDGTWNRNRA